MKWTRGASGWSSRSRSSSPQGLVVSLPAVEDTSQEEPDLERLGFDRERLPRDRLRFFVALARSAQPFRDAEHEHGVVGKAREAVSIDREGLVVALRGAQLLAEEDPGAAVLGPGFDVRLKGRDGTLFVVELLVDRGQEDHRVGVVPGALQLDACRFGVAAPKQQLAVGERVVGVVRLERHGARDGRLGLTRTARGCIESTEREVEGGVLGLGPRCRLERLQGFEPPALGDETFGGLDRIVRLRDGEREPKERGQLGQGVFPIARKLSFAAGSVGSVANRSPERGLRLLHAPLPRECDTEPIVGLVGVGRELECTAKECLRRLERVRAHLDAREIQ